MLRQLARHRLPAAGAGLLQEWAYFANLRPPSYANDDAQSQPRTTGRDFGALAAAGRGLAAQRQSALSCGAPLPLVALGAAHGALDQQRRGLKWAFWRRDDDAAAAAPSEPPVDTAVVEQIVALAGPDSMDAATWAMIHSGVWLHTWAAQGLLQSVHDATHMPWLLVIPMSVAVTRSALLPVLVYTQRVTHAMGEAKPKMDAAQLKFRAEMERGVPMQEAQAKYMRAMNDIYAKQGINPLAVPGMMLIQVPVFMAFYYAFTNMCDASLPSMVAESAMWGFDWTKVHPMHLFNLTVPATMMLHGYLSMSVMWQAQTDGMRQAIKYAAFLLPVVITGAVWSVPAAMCYYWTCSNIYSTAADLAFRVPSVRKALGMPTWEAKMALAMRQKLEADKAGGPFAALLAPAAGGSMAPGAGAAQPQAAAPAPPPPPPTVLPPVRPMPARSIGPPPAAAAAAAPGAEGASGSGQATGQQGGAEPLEPEASGLQIVVAERPARKAKVARRQQRQD